MKPLYLLVAFVLLVGVYSLVKAEVVAVANIEGIKITLHKDKCALTEVSNLPFMATWEEKGRLFSGCWAVMGGAVVGFFKEDKSIAVIPMQAFQRVTGV